MRLAESLGDSVTLFDESGKGAETSFEPGDIERFDSCVWSPGFPANHPWRQIAESSDKLCLSEIDFAARFWKGRIYGVTGTNGKTSLTTLLVKAFENTGRPSVAVGNIGLPFADAVLSDLNTAESVAVCEISSFQAELTTGTFLDGLLWTNFAEDHLDRYSDLEAYFAAKAQLFSCVKKEGPVVLGPKMAHWMQRFQIEGGDVDIAEPFSETDEVLPPSSPFFTGPQAENFAVAARFWERLGLSSLALIKAAEEFELGPHRLNLVSDWNGVLFWNDSKATNFHATLGALKSMTGSVYWIGGGQSKGGDLTGFAQSLAPQVERAFLYGEVAEALADALEGEGLPVEIEVRCEAVIEKAFLAAQSFPPNHLLFSPGFASFDQFSSYAERGKCFTDKVLGLKRRALSR